MMRQVSPDHSAAATLPEWKRELVEGLADPLALLRFIGLDADDLPGPIDSASPFPTRVPRGFARLMHPDPADPLLRQVLALAEERRPAPGFVQDPVGDAAAELTPGLLRKYRGRALLVLTGACAIHCRYCFRRHFPYTETGPLGQRIERSLAVLRHSPDIEELILSGGDPLMLDDEVLAGLVERLAGIPHLRRLRVHTRLPVVLPSRITDRLLSLLRQHRPRAVMVIHANHPRELSPRVETALDALHGARVPLLNQSVLLRGVNDDADVLAELSERLFDTGVGSYYLHQLDRVQGAAHFEVPDTEARRLMDALRKRLPGYLVPRLVREIPGADHKVPVI